MRLALIDDLVTEPLPAGSNLLVEFDPTSPWYAASFTIAAGWLGAGGGVSYNAFAQPPDNVRSKLKRLGLDVEALEGSDKLRIWDWYSATLGQKSVEKFAVEQSYLKVADMSIFFAKEQLRGPLIAERLRIGDNWGTLARFNDEKSVVEFALTRGLPMSARRQSTQISAIIRGIHSEWFYKQLEAAVDGVIDFKVEETAGETRDLIRIRSLRSCGFDRRWHKLNVDNKGHVTIER